MTSWGPLCTLIGRSDGVCPLERRHVLHPDSDQTLKEAPQFAEIRKKCLFSCFRCLTNCSWILKLICYHLKRRGILPILFVLNDEEDFDYAVSSGAIGMMTDRPRAAAQYYRSKGVELT